MSRVVSLISKVPTNTLLLNNIARAANHHNNNNIKATTNLFTICQRNFPGGRNRRSNDMNSNFDDMQDFDESGDDDNRNEFSRNESSGRGGFRGGGRGGRGNRMQRNRSFGDDDTDDFNTNSGPDFGGNDFGNQRDFGGRGRGRGRGGFRNRVRDYENAEVIKNRLMISNIPFASTPDDIRALMSKFGTVTEVQLPPSSRESLTNRGFGFVSFEREEDCAKAISQLNGTEFQQRTIKVFPAKNLSTNNSNQNQN